MKFNEHSDLQGSHAFLSASQYHWINYSDEKLDATYLTRIAAAKGTELHNFAAEAIRLKIKLQSSRATLNKYVNDCIGFDMVAEQVLRYSDNAFGTADAIRFVAATKTKRPKLMVSDLKTGVTATKFTQLMVYCAFFCLEYGFKPTELDFEMRIYQNDEVRVLTIGQEEPLPNEPDIDSIMHIMDRIVTFDRRIETLKAEVF